MKLLLERLKRRFTGKYKDLGWMNGWKSSKPEYDYCVKKGHQHWVTNKGRCDNVYRCPICRITWEVDSSD